MLLIAALTGTAVAGSARAAVTRTLLATTDVPGTALETRLYRITYSPAASAPRHNHPVVGLGYVIEGAAVSRFDGESLRTLAAGHSFRDRAGTPHVLFRNASATRRLVFLIAYTVRKGAPVTVFDSAR